MKIIHKDLKKGIIKLKVTRLDDLWAVYMVLKKGDTVTSQTTRKIKLAKEDSRQKAQSIIKKKVKITLQVENVSFHKYSDILRISGIIIAAPEDIKKGSHHTISIQPESVLEINKSWLNFEIQKLNDACAEKKSKVLICILDRDQACFAFLKEYGYDYLSEIEGDVQKKQEIRTATQGPKARAQKPKSSFYQDIKNKIQEYLQRENIEHIIIASPAFFKENLLKELPTETQKKCILATCHSFGKNAVEEVIKRTEVQTALKQERVAKETQLIQGLLKQISKQKLAIYGPEQTKKAIEYNAAKEIFISTDYIHKLKQDEDSTKYEALTNLLKQAEKNNTQIHIISSENQAGKELDGLTGIAAILRFEIE